MKNKTFKSLLLATMVGILGLGLTGCNDPKPVEYDILVDSRITNGTVVPSKTKAIKDELITVTVTPNTGYQLVDGSLKMNGELIVNNQFTMPEANAQITAQFGLCKYSVSVDSTISHGTITVDKTTASYGDTVTVSVVADYGYALVEGSLKANDVAISNGSFTMPAKDVVVTGSFAEDTGLVLGDVKVGEVNYVLTGGFREASGQYKAETTSFGQQYAFFKNVNAENVMVSTKINVSGKKAEEAHPRFGLAAVNTSNNRAVVFNIDGGDDLTGREARIETGLYNAAGWIEGEWGWGEYVMGNIPSESAYTGQTSVEMTLIKYNDVFCFFVDGKLLGVSSVGGFTKSDKVVAGLVTFETMAKFSEYSVTTKEADIVSKLPSEVASLTGSVAFADGLATQSVVGTEDFAGKSVTFYGKAEENGLHLAAKAVHARRVDTENDWWMNTNFEFFINGGNQFYVSMKQGLFSRGCFAVIKSSQDGTSGLYTTIVEVFVPNSLIPGYSSEEPAKVGFAWKTAGDQINNTNNSPTEYWLVKGHEANQLSQQFLVTSAGIVTPESLGTFANVEVGDVVASTTARFDLSHDNQGSGYVCTTHDGNTYEQQFAFFKNVIAKDVIVTAEINVISKKDGENCPRFGLALVSDEGRALVYNVDGGAELNGREVRAESGHWNGSWIGDPWTWGEHCMGNMPENASYKGEGFAKFTLVKFNGVIYFYINDVAMGSKAISGFGKDANVAVALATMETEAKFTHYSASKDVNVIKDYLGIDGTAAWAEGLEKVGIVGTDDFAGKDVYFTAKLTEEGLYLAATAHHGIFTTDRGNWWENTNFEFFVDGGHQFWVNAQGGLKTCDKAVAAISHSGSEGAYTTTFEVFISRMYVEGFIHDGGIRVGFAWKTGGDLINHCHDGENNVNEYWQIPGHPANSDAQWLVTSEGIQLS